MRALINPASSVYKYTEDLEPQSLPSSVSRTPPGESFREEVLLNKLGTAGWGRLHHFRNYQAGWGDRNGRPISGKALESFYRFIERANLPPNRKPSVFLTDRGGVELCWEDLEDRSIQMEFWLAGIEIYRASNESEFVLPLGDIENALNLVS